MTVVDVAATPPPVPDGFAPSPPPPPPPAARFIGDQNAYWRLLVRGSALLAVTLGIYRFWFATDVRRFLWSGTEISGETLEYSGTATELLIGFLIAIAVLVPLNLMLFVAALGLGPVGQFASSLSFPILFFLGQFAIYRARRYRLTRTIYRGVRCHQDGSALRYAVCGCFWWIMIVLTLGLAYPFAVSRLERFKMRHTYYGNLQGRFEGSGWRLFFRGLLMWLAVIGPLAFAAIYVAAAVDWDAVTAASRTAKDGAAFLKALGAIPYSQSRESGSRSARSSSVSSWRRRSIRCSRPSCCAGGSEGFDWARSASDRVCAPARSTKRIFASSDSACCSRSPQGSRSGLCWGASTRR